MENKNILMAIIVVIVLMFIINIYTLNNQNNKIEDLNIEMVFFKNQVQNQVQELNNRLQNMEMVEGNFLVDENIFLDANLIENFVMDDFIDENLPQETQLSSYLYLYEDRNLLSRGKISQILSNSLIYDVNHWKTVEQNTIYQNREITFNEQTIFLDRTDNLISKEEILSNPTKYNVDAVIVSISDIGNVENPNQIIAHAVIFFI